MLFYQLMDPLLQKQTKSCTEEEGCQENLGSLVDKEPTVPCNPPLNGWSFAKKHTVPRSNPPLFTTGNVFCEEEGPREPRFPSLSLSPHTLLWCTCCVQDQEATYTGQWKDRHNMVAHICNTLLLYSFDMYLDVPISFCVWLGSCTNTGSNTSSNTDDDKLYQVTIRRLRHTTVDSFVCSAKDNPFKGGSLRGTVGSLNRLQQKQTKSCGEEGFQGNLGSLVDTRVEPWYHIDTRTGNKRTVVKLPYNYMVRTDLSSAVFQALCCLETKWIHNLQFPTPPPLEIHS